MRVYLIGRQDDTADLRDRIADQILYRYGMDSLVRDIRGRTVEEYSQQVQVWMRMCRVALVVLGPDWVQATDAYGRRLLDNPSDPVRVEVRTALEQRLLVVPLLVRGATMPRADALPPDMAALTIHQGSKVRGDPDFADDMRVVYAQINTQLTWRPASSLTLIASSAGFLAGFATIGAYFLGGIGALVFLCALLMLAGLLVAGAAGITLSFRRRHWLWLGGLALALLAVAASLVVPAANGDLEFAMLFICLGALLAFALFGPRRETVGV